jgi:hypothetical protein
MRPTTDFRKRRSARLCAIVMTGLAAIATARAAERSRRRQCDRRLQGGGNNWGWCIVDTDGTYSWDGNYQIYQFGLGGDKPLVG